METVKPLTWEEAKDQVAKNNGYEKWKYLCKIHDGTPWITKAAELYASSRVRALEEELAQVKNDWALAALQNGVDAIEIGKLKNDIEGLKSTMIAAAEEIQAHWPAHCDSEGYGPSNLMHRLEQGIPAHYDYKAGDFEKLDKENKRLQERLEAVKSVVCKKCGTYNSLKP